MEGEIEALRRQRLSGPAIARRLGRPVSTVGVVLRRRGLGRLAALDPRPPVIRYERETPGELIHIDTKKLGRISHRITGDRTGQSNKRGTGWEYLHVAVEDASRLAYTEILPGERKENAIAFTRRALAWFARFGIMVSPRRASRSADSFHYIRSLVFWRQIGGIPSLEGGKVGMRQRPVQIAQ